ncbi:glycosyltransferase family 2 protein, partial [bacterium]|nr:glycosyltransferase family 2 protein [bacterium]
LIATRFRSALLSRLLSSLASQTLEPLAAVICDNGPDPATAEAVKNSPIPSRYLSLGKNLGFGGGLALAGQHALEKFPSLTHLLIVDDDAILSPSDLATLLSSMEKNSAGSIAPFLIDFEGKLQEVPEPASWTLARAFRGVGQNLPAARTLSSAGYPMAWCIGPCLLIDRSTWLRAGAPRSDMIAYGDDVEFSLRLSAAAPAWAEPSVAVIHAPPAASRPPSDMSSEALAKEEAPALAKEEAPPESARLGAKEGRSTQDRSAHYKKFGILLQNLAFTCVTSPRPRHLPLYLPGNARRFLKTFGPTPANILEVFRRYALGLLGLPPSKIQN